ncbi:MULTISPECIES: TonB-dependent siderophore receptor [unclassified Mesorhizobium]|uniref:TonB-dependent siderophore receptor n=1 Tax=unclassified Mesorhizobium TaxID=325217 RepID=UPI001128603D|nr:MULTISPECIES: TonB-dependent siderophore receptor [unclassified Mesorhizobium]TPK61864.1 TonB-dependent siderophore receptor [Mesorhizobium sp. B2-5-1]TPM64934.1 TonB-dependent siderophore receptor [Mesorhizobium sp. B2-1-9]TPM86958.1 TonB-dependent siderophore receptor [Mesorhizobium sp. B2-1-4]TPN14481.1 TonB-dependent siderophore receptor [Mesorhizobium sp. B2-1-2]UCI12548.1 TonB-dependent siderophore receptor [Mesorhizobium sp. B2-1-1]
MSRIYRIKALLAAGVAAAAMIPPMPAFAQTAQSSTQLEPVVVEGEAGDSATGPVDGVVAKTTRTGSKTATDIKEVPQSVSVVGRQEIEDQGAQKADEALRYTAGAFAQPFGPDSDTNWMYIRGFDATATGTYMDGLQLFSYGFGGFYVDSFGLERIEVLKGPASVLYGGSNPGGLVNYVSKRPDFERTRYVETGINDAGNVYLGFDIGDVASNGTVSYRMTGKVAGGDTYSDLQNGWRGFISPSISWKPDEATTLTILANYSHIDENHNGGSFLPYDGTVVDHIVGGVNYGRIDPDANFTEPSIDLYKREQGSLGYELEHTFDNDWTVRSSARFTAADINEVSVYPNGWSTIGGPTELARINFDHDTTAKTFLADNQIEGKVATGAIEHTILAGVDFKYYNIDQVQSSGLYDPNYDNPIDAFDPVYGSPLTPRVSYLNQDLTQKQLGFYAQDQMRFGDGWLVTLNGRYDRGWLEADNRPTYYSAGSSTQSSTVGDFSGRAGLAYEFANGVTPYASIATFFNPIIGTDAMGNLFKPEEGTQYEVGVKYVPTFVDGLFTLSLFDLTRQNVPSNVTPFTQMQTGEVRSRGVELEGKVNVTEDFRLTGAFTAYDIDITRDANPALVGKTPFIVPEVMASASVDYTFRGDWYDGISIGGGLRYIGSSWADNENTAKVPAVTLADLKLGYEKENWGVDLNITNLFDKSYVSSCQTTLTCSYGEGRSFKLKAHTSW